MIDLILKGAFALILFRGVMCAIQFTGLIFCPQESINYWSTLYMKAYSRYIKRTAEAQRFIYSIRKKLQKK
jgi:hypothetical protein